MNDLNSRVISASDTILDLGCGLAKVQGAWGVDVYPYPEVNQVLDADIIPWDLPPSQFETIYAQHIIEHVSSIVDLMNEIHRISKHEAIIHIVTPHFSSIDSYKDPTHKRHLATGWYSIFTESYLKSQIAKFTHVKTEITFGRSTFRFIPKLIIAIKGIEWWEKKLAFMLRARNIKTTLQVVKD